MVFLLLNFLVELVHKVPNNSILGKNLVLGGYTDICFMVDVIQQAQGAKELVVLPTVELNIFPRMLRALKRFVRKPLHALNELSMSVFFFQINLLVFVAYWALDAIELIYGLVVILLTVIIGAVDTHFIIARHHHGILSVNAHLFVAKGTRV